MNISVHGNYKVGVFDQINMFSRKTLHSFGLSLRRHWLRCDSGSRGAAPSASALCSPRHFCEAPTATSFHVQDYDDFDERVVHSDVPVVVEFFADWCGPCRLLAPRLEAKVDARHGRVLLAKVNIEDHEEIVDEYGVQAVPTVLAFDGGAVVDKLDSQVEDDVIDAFLSRLLNE